jgi:hypothetical protein
MRRRRAPGCTVGRRLDPHRIRELEAEIISSRQASDPNLHLLQGPELFGPGDIHDLPDGLHPNAAGYQRMGERAQVLRLLQRLRGWLKEGVRLRFYV